jgi:peptide/nickel transport system substrate-binding protein
MKKHIEGLVNDFQGNRINRREFLVSALSLGMTFSSASILLAACSQAGTTDSTDVPQAAATEVAVSPTEIPPEGPRKGGSIEYGIHNELQPIHYNTPWMSEAAAVDVYERLTRVTTDGKLVGQLAESYEVSDDGLTITFKIREGKKYHNGDVCDALALKELFDWWINPEGDYRQPFYQAVTSVEAPDNLTLVLHLDHVDSSALLGTKFLYSPIINLREMNESPDEYGRSIVVGTGPFKFESWEGNSTTTVRNEEFFGSPDLMQNTRPAHLDSIKYTYLADQGTRSINLESGDFDIIENPAPQDVIRLEQNPKIVVIKRPAPAIMYFGFNFKNELLQDRNVREAIYRAVERNAIVGSVMFGQANPAYSPVVPHDPAYWAGSETLYPYDLDKAKALLNEAGWSASEDGVRMKDGSPLEFALILLGGSEQTTIAQVLQDQLAQIGVKINLEVLDKGTHQSRQFEGQYDLNLFRFWYDSSIDVLKILYHTDRMPPNGANWAFFSNPDADRGFDAYNTVTDPDERREAIIDVQRALLGEVAMVPLYNPIDVWAMRTWVKGFTAQSTMPYHLHNDWWVTEDSPRA